MSAVAFKRDSKTAAFAPEGPLWLKPRRAAAITWGRAWTVRRSQPAPARLAVAFSTVAPMSCSLRSMNTRLPARFTSAILMTFMRKDRSCDYLATTRAISSTLHE